MSEQSVDQELDDVVQSAVDDAVRGVLDRVRSHAPMQSAHVEVVVTMNVQKQWRSEGGIAAVTDDDDGDECE